MSPQSKQHNTMANIYSNGEDRQKIGDADTCLPKLEPVKRVALILSFLMTTSLRRSIFFKRELASFSVLKITKEKRF